MTARTDQPCPPRPRTYLATITADAHSLGWQGLTLAPDARRAVEHIGETRIHVNADATPEAADRHAVAAVVARVALALGYHHGLTATMNLTAGTGQVCLAQAGRTGILAVVQVESGDSPLAEILGDVA